MQFSVLFWNIWLDNQIHGGKKYADFIKEFDELLIRYNPDFLVLNEVMVSKSQDSPIVVEHIKKMGYKYTNYTADSPRANDWIMGQAICSRTKPLSVKEIVVSNNPSAEKRGFKGQNKTATVAEFNLRKGTKLNLVVTHLLYLRKHTIREHYRGAKNLEQLMKNYSDSNTLLLGDLNQPGFMPRSFKKKTKQLLNRKSGSIINPTWRHRASKNTIIRANLDQLYWTKNSELKLTGFEVITADSSDHRPIFAEFAID